MELGTPEKVLLGPSKCSQSGAPDILYVRSSEEDVKVDFANVNLNGSSALATGGTCAFMGNDTLGFAVTVVVSMNISKMLIILGLSYARTCSAFACLQVSQWANFSDRYEETTQKLFKRKRDTSSRSRNRSHAEP